MSPMKIPIATFMGHLQWIARLTVVIKAADLYVHPIENITLTGEELLLAVEVKLVSLSEFHQYCQR